MKALNFDCSPRACSGGISMRKCNAAEKWVFNTALGGRGGRNISSNQRLLQASIMSQYVVCAHMRVNNFFLCICLHDTLKKKKKTSSTTLFSVCLFVISVQIFLVRYLEAPTDSISSNLSDWVEDYYLLLYPPSPATSNRTPLWQGCVRETKRQTRK